MRYIALMALFAPMTAMSAEDPPVPSAEEIVKHCDYKYPGDDQRSVLTIILKDSKSDERTNRYLRLWKDAKGKNDIVDKMLLFTTYPPDAKGIAFMRWAFVRGKSANADQWIYLPSSAKTRKVSVRDPGDSFLGSDLTYADISGRYLDEDTHKLIKSEKNPAGEERFIVESTPKESEPLYSKRVQTFQRKNGDWDNCVKIYVDYFDKRGERLKNQSLTWQKVGPAWVWDKVAVQNVQTMHASMFRVTDVEINVGLKDDVFEERMMQKGYGK